MRWSVIRTIWFREVRDQLRDRRTVFMLVVLPILLYPALGMGMVWLLVRFAEQPMKIGIAGTELLEASPGPEGQPGRFSLTELPPLLEGNHFAAALFKGKNLRDYRMTEVIRGSETDLATMLQRGEIQAYVVINRGFVDDLRAGKKATVDLRLRGGERRVSDGPAPSTESKADVFLRTQDERSELAHARLESVFREWEKLVVKARMRVLETPEDYDDPLRIPDVKFADRAERAWSRVFPFMIVMMSLTGALYPAIDVCAGEKERGTMETLLISPVSRTEIVWGKFMTVWLFSGITALLNLGSMGLTAWYFSAAAAPILALTEGAIPAPSLAGLGWCMVLLVPLAAFFSAVCVALAVYARSTREGQYYLMPLTMVAIPLTLVAVMPGAELTPLYSMLPITGATLLLQSLMSARSAEQIPWLYLAPVLLPLAAYCYLSLRWAVQQFNREEVLFREAARLDLGLWVRNLLRDKEALPTPTEAMACFISILFLIWFVSTGAARAPILTQVSVLQLVAVATPALMMALFLTSKPLETLRLRRPALVFIPLSIVLAISLHFPLATLTVYVVQQSPQVEEAVRTIAEHLIDEEMSLWSQIAVLAALPALCEELAFRGFILSGLSRRMGPGKAVFTSSLLFAISHLNAFRFLPTLILGFVLGLLAVRSRSLLPGMLLHFTHNTMIVTVIYYGNMVKKGAGEPPWWFWGEEFYSAPAIIGGTALVLVLLGALLLMRRGDGTNNDVVVDEPK